MVFLSGARQVGKTTLARELSPFYVSWDREKDRQLIISGADKLAEKCGILNRLQPEHGLIAFDEIHRYSHWKTFLKGFFDSFEGQVRIIATGSARMDIYKRGGDSMMGRYFPYHIHPFSVAELTDPTIPNDCIIRSPREIPEEDWQALLEFGGFPEPFSMRDHRFSRKWHSLRFEQLLRSDVRDISRTMEVDLIEQLAAILANRSGEQLVYSSLAHDLNVTEPTVKQWISVLKSLYYGFEIRPWFRNVENSLRKTPKWYLRDWSQIEDEGKRNETMAACHLLKAAEGWTDLGFGDFALYYLRDKQKHEVDFLVTKDNNPWFLVEVKTSDTKITSSLEGYQRKTGARHAFQAVFNLPFENADCFAKTDPVIVSARTLFSQLV